jgi:hypothetical protein
VGFESGSTLTFNHNKPEVGILTKLLKEALSGIQDKPVFFCEVRVFAKVVYYTYFLSYSIDSVVPGKHHVYSPDFSVISQFGQGFLPPFNATFKVIPGPKWEPYKEN